jgi:hypothetical protein
MYVTDGIVLTKSVNASVKSNTKNVSIASPIIARKLLRTRAYFTDSSPLLTIIVQTTEFLPLIR